MKPPKVSSAAQWMTCRGSVKAQQDFPAPAGDVPLGTLEGRAIHEVAEGMLQALKGDPNAPLTGIVGTLSKDGIVITQELYDAAREYTNEVWGYANRREKFKLVQIEQRVSLEHLAPGWFGYIDAYLVDHDRKVVTVWDCKGGHRLVEAEDNWQLFLYAHAVMNSLTMSQMGNYTDWSFDLRVVQPRAYHKNGTVRPWTFNHQTYCEKLTVCTDAVNAIVAGDISTRAGTHCMYCSARAHCATLAEHSYAGMDYVKQLSTHNLDGAQLGVELKMLRQVSDMIKMRLAGIEEQVLHEIRSGKVVPFFTAREGKGRETWRKDVPIEQLIRMGDLLGVDIRKPVTLDTPAQCRKKGIDESVIAEYIETPSTGLKLVEVEESTARNVFTRGL
ncbi:MAG: DUF2800 domain-containing protein [Plesiomonas sp.]